MTFMTITELYFAAASPDGPAPMMQTRLIPARAGRLESPLASALEDEHIFHTSAPRVAGEGAVEGRKHRRPLMKPQS